MGAMTEATTRTADPLASMGADIASNPRVPDHTGTGAAWSSGGRVVEGVPLPPLCADLLTFAPKRPVTD
jgi:hypothetical protein